MIPNANVKQLKKYRHKPKKYNLFSFSDRFTCLSSSRIVIVVAILFFFLYILCVCVCAEICQSFFFPLICLLFIVIIISRRKSLLTFKKNNVARTHTYKKIVLFISMLLDFDFKKYQHII